MTDHPCTGRSQAQIEAFNHIAIGQSPRCSRLDLFALERDGLVSRTRGRWLSVRYEVPIHLLAQWFRWYFEQPEGDDENPI